MTGTARATAGTDDEAAPPGDPDPATADGGLVAWLRRGDHLAALVFAVVVCVAVPIIVHQGRDQWFFLDEWVFIVGRDLSLDGLMKPHNEHWTLLPIFIYRVLFRLFGIRSYLPYQAVVIGFHLGSAVLLRLVMRRAGVSAWVATATATAFVFFGSGRQDVLWAFQMSFSGSLFFGLAQLLLADHDGPIGRRDVLALLCGLLGLMSSGVAVVLVAVVGAAVLVRRGWRPAVLQVVPLGAAWAGWWAVYGRSGYQESSGLGGALSYTWRGIGNGIAKLSPVWGVGFVLGAVLVAGMVLALRRDGGGGALRRLALPVCLAGGAVAFMAVTGYGRADRTGNDVPFATRYVHLVAAMLFPILGVALDELVRWKRVVGVIAVGVLLIGIPANIEAFRPHDIELYTKGSPTTVLVGARLPEMRQLPPNRPPFSYFEGPVTARWILAALDNGKLGDAPATTADERATIALGVSLAAEPITPPAEPTGCATLTGPTDRRLRAGDVVRFVGQSVSVVLHRRGGTSAPVEMVAPSQAQLRAVAGPLHLTIAPAGSGPVSLCR